MHTETEHLEFVAAHLSKEIEDPKVYLKSVRGKFLKQEFKKLLRHMQPTDQIWEREWFGPTEPRNSYSLGWCIVRNGSAIESHCRSFS